MSVLVTGGTGFIAQYIIQGLLDQKYRVISTVRSDSKREKLYDDYKRNSNLVLEIVPDISKLDAFEEVLKKHGKDLKYVIHTASPVTMNAKDLEKDMMIPSVNGVKGILSSVKKYANDTVEQVVYTASIASAINLKDRDSITDEESWNPITWEESLSNGLFAYFGSKKFGEKAAWEFIDENRDEIKFGFTTILPVYVFGPQLFESNLQNGVNGSNGIPYDILHSNADDTKILTKYNEPGFVDVRDVANAHVKAIQDKAFIGKRVILQNSAFSSQDILDILNKEFADALGGKIPVGKPGSGVYFGKATKQKINDNMSRQLLGNDGYVALEDCIKDFSEQILAYEQKKINT